MPLHLRACLIAGFLILLAFLSAARSGPRIELRVPVRLATAPTDFWVTIFIEPRPEHRWLIVEADGAPGDYRRSDIALEGDRAARIRQYWFKSLSAGCYIFAVSVYDSAHRLASASSPPVSILGHEGDPCL